MVRLLRSLGGFLAERKLEPALLEIAGTPVVITFRRHPKARRLIIRVARDGKSFSLTLPPRASRKEAIAFAERSRLWIAGRLSKTPAAIPFAPGSVIPLRGIGHVIVHRPGARGSVWRDGETITVAGDPVHLVRRLRDWLKLEARRDLLAASERYAQLMEARFSRLSVRDQSSRWGSCSAGGSLSYSWRLIFAPAFVLDYVAAHEVGHLRHMDHSARYWRLVLTHCPRAREAQHWLRRHGAGLHRYG